jgi:uncharacterized protein YfaP (DUF2135 family)
MVSFRGCLVRILLGVLLSLVASAAVERQNGKIVSPGKEKIKITLDAPKGGWTVDRMVEVSGKVSDDKVNPIAVSINGDRYLMKTFAGKFKRKFPVVQGKNSISVIAANKVGTFKASRSLFANVPPVSFMAVLTSDTDGVYTDLHVYEPSATGEPTEEPKVHIYWADTSSESGGKFYLNEQGGSFDQPGYGPYLYTHASPPVGIYRIDGNYWPSGDKAHTLGTLNLVLFGGTPNEIRRRVQQPLVMPGETVTFAYVRVNRGGTASVYVPEVDTKPKDEKVWPKWVVDAPARKKSAGGEYY